MGDDSTCNMDGVGIVFIKMFDEMVRELKDVTYVLQMKKNLTSVETLEAQGLEFSDRGRVFKMPKGYMVVLTGVKRNNHY